MLAARDSRLPDLPLVLARLGTNFAYCTELVNGWIASCHSFHPICQSHMASKGFTLGSPPFIMPYPLISLGLCHCPFSQICCIRSSCVRIATIASTAQPTPPRMYSIVTRTLLGCILRNSYQRLCCSKRCAFKCWGHRRREKEINFRRDNETTSPIRGTLRWPIKKTRPVKGSNGIRLLFLEG